MSSSTARERRLERLALAASFLVPLALYLRTLARSVTWIDGGELAAVAATLGIAHPPGYPLFTLLGHLFAQIPIGAVYSRIALLSAVATAGASAILFRILWSLIRPADGSAWDHALGLASALGGALLFAVADSPWSQAVVVEVYALHALLVALLLAACIRVATPGARAPLYTAGFWFGMGLAHHLTMVLLAPAIAVALVLAGRDRSRGATFSARALGSALGLALIPLLLYLYLPIRSRLGPAVNWDYPESWFRFVSHATAAQYRPMLSAEGLKFAEMKAFFSGQLPQEATFLFPLLALAGAILLGRARPRLLWLTLPPVGACVVYNALYLIPDIGVYYLPVLLIGALWAGFALASIGRRCARAGAPARFGFLVALLGLVAWPAGQNFERNDLSRNQSAAAYGRDLLRQCEPKAIVFSDDPNHVSQPMLYLQQVERLRPDVLILDLERLESPMLERSLAQWCPDLATACRAEVAATTHYAALAERRLPYDGKAWDHAYDTMMWTLAHQAVALRPTYSLLGAVDRPMFSGLHSSPEGLLARYRTDDAYHPVALPNLELPRLLAGRPPSEQERTLLAQYVRMLDGRVWYEGKHGNPARADSLRALREEVKRGLGVGR
ncbi:MAG: DUF2723 domain-containing protein [Candidatus Eisenbacteria bacterium]|nr:DUF2723 domain-containing protein [Candidatus Eisenbacteria bacterium]